MLRQAMSASAPEVVDGFRQRGMSVSRLECFCDCVFGFALTLLVVSLEVPKSFVELTTAMRGFFAFAMTFATLAMVWNRHYSFCRRYGLEDGVVRFLSLLLLFVVLAYIYPLKFLTTLFINGVLGVDVASAAAMKITASEIRQLFVLYGSGFAGVTFLWTLFYGHAYRLRGKLELSEWEVVQTKLEIVEQLWMLTVPLLSIVLALTLPLPLIGWAGFVYFMLGFVGWFNGMAQGRARRRLGA
jgi:uncharacterized membrane protein